MTNDCSIPAYPFLRTEDFTAGDIGKTRIDAGGDGTVSCEDALRLSPEQLSAFLMQTVEGFEWRENPNNRPSVENVKQFLLQLAERDKALVSSAIKEYAKFANVTEERLELLEALRDTEYFVEAEPQKKTIVVGEGCVAPDGSPRDCNEQPPYISRGELHSKQPIGPEDWWDPKFGLRMQVNERFEASPSRPSLRNDFTPGLPSSVASPHPSYPNGLALPGASTRNDLVPPPTGKPGDKR